MIRRSGVSSLTPLDTFSQSIPRQRPRSPRSPRGAFLPFYPGTNSAVLPLARFYPTKATLLLTNLQSNRQTNRSTRPIPGDTQWPAFRLSISLLSSSYILCVRPHFVHTTRINLSLHPLPIQLTKVYESNFYSLRSDIFHPDV